MCLLLFAPGSFTGSDIKTAMRCQGCFKEPWDTGGRQARCRAPHIAVGPHVTSSRHGAVHFSSWEHHLQMWVTLPQASCILLQGPELHLGLFASRHTAAVQGAPASTSPFPTCSHTVGPILSNSLSPTFPPSFSLQAPPMNY